MSHPNNPIHVCSQHEIHYLCVPTVWFGKREYIICGIITPFALSFLLAFGYIRNELDHESKNIFDSAISFFQGQGVSVNVIGYAKECEGTYPETNISYTFGPIIQELKHNPVSNFFGLFPFYKSQELEAVYHKIGRASCRERV